MQAILLPSFDFGNTVLLQIVLQSMCIMFSHLNKHLDYDDTPRMPDMQ